jgi:YHS domain-containing protein
LRLIIRLIQFVLWVAFATWLGRKLLGWFFGEAGRGEAGAGSGTAPFARQDAGGTKGSKLHRDPVCGTHVPEAISFPLELQGEVQHFCSMECREKFRASARATPSSSRGFGTGAASA